VIYGDERGFFLESYRAQSVCGARGARGARPAQPLALASGNRAGGCTTYYDSVSEGGFRCNDPAVGIEWPTDVELISSVRDAGAPPLSEIVAALPFEYAA
jgi:dTDP-4-dehydrorhamnose 3,5-epimerase-like enzyme